MVSNCELYFGLLNIVLCFQSCYNPLGNVYAFLLEENWKFCFIFFLVYSSLSCVGSGLSSVCIQLFRDLWGAYTAFSSVQFSHSVVSNSLQPHGLQHARLLCPSPSPRAYSNSYWVGDAIQPSHPLSSLSSPAFNLSQHQSLFQWVSSSHQVARLLEFQLQHQSFQSIFRTDFLYDGLVRSPCSPRDSQESSTPQFKSINSLSLSFLYSPTLTSIHDYWKNHSLD